MPIGRFLTNTNLDDVGAMLEEKKGLLKGGKTGRPDYKTVVISKEVRYSGTERVLFRDLSCGCRVGVQFRNERSIKNFSGT
jgi:hypothetical protein